MNGPLALGDGSVVNIPWMLKRNETSCVNTRRTAPPPKKFIYNSIHCALEFISCKEEHSIQCLLLNVSTQQKVIREWSNATGPPLYLPYSLHLNGQLYLSQPLSRAFFQCVRCKSWILETSFFTNLPFLSIDKVNYWQIYVHDLIVSVSF